MTTWTIVLGILGLLSLFMGFAWRMGYEFSKVRQIVSKARYLSFYGYQISIEKGFVKLDCSVGSGSFTVSSAYPSVNSFYPFVLQFTDLSVNITDESDAIVAHDYSNYRLELPNLSPWKHTAVRLCISLLNPRIEFGTVEYVYKTSSLQPTVVKLSKCSLDISKYRFVSEGGLVVRGCIGSDSFVLETDRLECRLSPESLEAEIACETVQVTYSVYDSFQKLIERFSNFVEPIPPIPSSVRIRLSYRIQSSIKIVLESVPSNSSVEILVSMNGNGGMSLKKLRGIYARVEVDPFSTLLMNFSIHNFNDTRNHRTLSSVSISTTAFVHNVPLIHIYGQNINSIFDSSESWNCSTRCGSVSLSLLTSDPSCHKLLQLKQVSLVGTSEKGLSVSVAAVDIDASPRMINRMVRVYSKLMSILVDSSVVVNSPMIPPSREVTSSTPVFTPMTVSDLNYVLIQKKFASSPPSMVPACVTPGLIRSDSTSTGLNDSTMSHSRDSKNWRYMERISSSGPDSEQSNNSSNRMLFSFIAGSIRIDSGNSDLFSEILTVKLVMKTSSIGTKFTSFNCDSVCVNDNIKSDGGGFRVWIDGDLSSDQSRVFCLVPPVSIRFDPKFAGIVERYFLDVAEALKGMSKSSPATARKMIEVLQVSSLKLELHAKEMLGVLSLDKAVINLNKSSVYKSHGFLDAVNSLATQYKADVTSQWLSLLMRLDVSIGRPMTTARKIIGTISGLFVNGNEDVNGN